MSRSDNPYELALVIDVLQKLATASVNNAVIDYPEHFTHVVVFDFPDKLVEAAITHTVMEGFLEYDNVLRLKCSQCVLTNENGAGGFNEHQQRYEMRIIQLRK